MARATRSEVSLLLCGTAGFVGEHEEYSIAESLEIMQAVGVAPRLTHENLQQSVRHQQEKNGHIHIFGVYEKHSFS